MAKCLFSALILSLLLAGQASANSDSVVFENGNVRISGQGNGLVFPNNSVQYTACAVVTENVSADASVAFPNGVASGAQTTCVQCPQGTVAVGGGGLQTAGGVGFVLMNGSYPTPDTSGWCVVWVGASPGAQTNNVQTWATCLQPTPN